MTSISFSDAERRTAFTVAEAELIREMGNVSIVKFLGGTDQATARENWFAKIEEFVEVLPDGVFIALDASDGQVALRLAGGSTVVLRLWEARYAPTLEDSWRIMLKPRLAPVVVDMVGTALWGDVWVEAVAGALEGEPLPVVPSGDRPFGTFMREAREQLSASGAVEATVRGWTVQAAPEDAPWPWFTDEQTAHRAAKALALGTDRIGALFSDWQRASDG
ncbi:MAG: hypothetical protein ABIR17_03565 [Pseudolysinimonas sp.]|uniref:hypothetical protein n=1 Tax=Pseudolysinimonas sp. TaxID=2680009 RepID=UPI003264D65E